MSGPGHGKVLSVGDDDPGADGKKERGKGERRGGAASPVGVSVARSTSPRPGVGGRKKKRGEGRKEKEKGRVAGIEAREFGADEASISLFPAPVEPAIGKKERGRRGKAGTHRRPDQLVSCVADPPAPWGHGREKKKKGPEKRRSKIWSPPSFFETWLSFNSLLRVPSPQKGRKGEGGGGQNRLGRPSAGGWGGFGVWGYGEAEKKKKKRKRRGGEGGLTEPSLGRADPPSPSWWPCSCPPMCGLGAVRRGESKRKRKRKKKGGKRGEGQGIDAKSQPSSAIASALPPPPCLRGSFLGKKRKEKKRGERGRGKTS